MASNDQWRRAFARQAKADLDTRTFLSLKEAARRPECHRLQFLQMACEKLVKAHLFTLPAVPDWSTTSHAVIAKHLPVIVGEYYRRNRGRVIPAHVLKRVRSLAREIELLNPAVDNAGQQPVNCEYPWIAPDDRVVAPADHSWPNLSLAQDPIGNLILKILPMAIEEFLR